MRSSLKKALIGCIILLGLVMIFAGMGENEQNALDKLTNDWINCYNTEPEKLSAFYADNALLFPEKNEFIQGNTLISSYYQEKNRDLAKIQAVKVQKRVKIRDTVVYELSEIVTEKEEKLQQLIIWQKKNNAWHRLLEGVSKKTLEDNTAAAELDAALKKWVASSRNVEALVTNLYTDHAVYYAPPIVSKGKADIISIYSKLFQPGTELGLTTVKLVQPSDDLAYEIGQYGGMSPGYYILIWQKDKESGWKVRLDSNM